MSPFLARIGRLRFGPDPANLAETRDLALTPTDRVQLLPSCVQDRVTGASGRWNDIPNSSGPGEHLTVEPLHAKHSLPMPRETGVPPGTLMMLVLRVLKTQRLHGYAIAQRIHQLSDDELRVEEGSLYPALQKLLVKGWVKAAWCASETGRRVREYRITPSGLRQLEAEVTEYRRMADAIGLLLERA